MNLFRTGIGVYIGRTNNLCPAAAVLERSRPRPIFLFSDGKPLTRAMLVTELVMEVKQALAAAGVDCRCYLVEWQPQLGDVDDATIKTLGCWKSSV